MFFTGLNKQRFWRRQKRAKNLWLRPWPLFLEEHFSHSFSCYCRFFLSLSLTDQETSYPRAGWVHTSYHSVCDCEIKTLPLLSVHVCSVQFRFSFYMVSMISGMFTAVKGCLARQPYWAALPHLCSES